MVRTRKATAVNPPAPDLATLVANLQQQLQQQQQELQRQQQETAQLRAQLAQGNQGPPVQAAPPPVQQVPPVAPPPVQNIPPVAPPEIQPGVQPNIGIPEAAIGVQMPQPPVQEGMLYERFRRMKAPEFEGTTDPVVTDNWLLDIQVILDFMGLTEHEKVICASFALKKNARHWWRTVQMRREVMIMSWADFVAKFKTMYYNKGSWQPNRTSS